MLFHSNQIKSKNKRIASFVVTLTSTFPGNQFGPLYYTVTLKFIDKSLKYNEGNINTIIKLSEDTLHEISWAKKNIFKVFKPTRQSKTGIAIYKDASSEVWVMCPQVRHSFQMRTLCIYVLELKAILLALVPLVKLSYSASIRKPYSDLKSLPRFVISLAPICNLCLDLKSLCPNLKSLPRFVFFLLRFEIL